MSPAQNKSVPDRNANSAVQPPPDASVAEVGSPDGASAPSIVQHANDKKLSMTDKFAIWLFSFTWTHWLLLGIALIVPKVVAEAYEFRLQEWFALIVYLLCEIGIAVLVFAFVSITVERFAREKVLEEHSRLVGAIETKHKKDRKEIKQDVLYNVLGIPLQPEVLGHVMEAVFRQTWYRKEYEIDFVFKDLDANHVLVDITRKYEVHNLCPEKRALNISHYCESLISHATAPTITGFAVHDGDRLICALGNHTLTLQPQLVCDRIRHGVRADVPVEPKRPLTVEFSCQLPMRKCDTQAFFTIFPANKMHVAAYVPASLGLEFFAEGAYRVPLPPTLVAATEVNKWSIDSPLLPGNGFVLSWRPRPAPPATTTAAIPAPLGAV